MLCQRPQHPREPLRLRPRLRQRRLRRCQCRQRSSYAQCMYMSNNDPGRWRHDAVVMAAPWGGLRATHQPLWRRARRLQHQLPRACLWVHAGAVPKPRGSAVRHVHGAGKRHWTQTVLLSAIITIYRRLCLPLTTADTTLPPPPNITIPTDNLSGNGVQSAVTRMQVIQRASTLNIMRLVLPLSHTGSTDTPFIKPMFQTLVL